VTIWQLRSAGANDDPQARLLVPEQDSEVSYIAERISADTKFKGGEKIRISVESPHTGYLYIVDREQYADGTSSDPYLIVPTLRTRGSNNAVAAGHLIEIPNQEVHPLYFNMHRSRPDQTGEVLTFLVTAQPLPNLELSRDALKLTNEQFAQWQQKF